MSQQHHQRMGFFAPGYKKLENREQKTELQQAIEEITPTPQENKVEGQEDEKKDDDLECVLQLSPVEWFRERRTTIPRANGDSSPVGNAC